MTTTTPIRKYTADMLNDPFFIGFDSLINRLNTANTAMTNYPPYNIVRTADNSYIIELAVAGFSETELDITVHGGTLFVKGETSPKDQEPKYLHRGIAARNFNRSFTLADTIEVVGAQVYNGMLQIRLENHVPEEMKPRKIAIGNVEPKPFTQLLNE
jgi:molecular chaperone IbpA